MRQDVSKRTMDNLKKKYQTSFRRWIIGKGGGGAIAPYIGNTREFVQKWIEERHLIGMTWGTYGEIWVVDHIVPLRLFDMTNKGELKLALHYKNLMPLYKADNMYKDGAIDFSLRVIERLPYCEIVRRLRERAIKENSRLDKYLAF